jgi:hypothetical protein
MDFPIPGLHGAYRRRDLVAAAGRRFVDNAVRNGLLRPLWTVVLVESRLLLDPWTRAAAGLLATGDRSVLVDSTAAYLHGCRSADPATTHVRVPYGREFRSRPGLDIHHGRSFADDIRDVDGLRVLALDRVVADLRCAPDGPAALSVTDEALRRARPQHEQLRSAVGARLRRRDDPRGTARGAVLLGLASPDAESPPESRLRYRLLEDGFPVPEVNWRVVGPGGEEIFRIDLAWPQLRIALEYDGYEAHAGREEADEARQCELERRGWIVVRVSKEDFPSLSRVYAELRSAFARRGYVW